MPSMPYTHTCTGYESLSAVKGVVIRIGWVDFSTRLQGGSITSTSYKNNTTTVLVVVLISIGRGGRTPSVRHMPGSVRQ